MIISDGCLSYNELMNMPESDIKIFAEAYKEIKKKQSGK